MAVAESKHSRALGDSGEVKGGSDDFSISSKAVEMITMLLSHPSAGMAAERYFEMLAPQLLHLLDGDDGPELSRVAASVISRGILSKQKTGAPGSIGWTLFVAPCHATVDPRDSADKARSQGVDLPKTVVSELSLDNALVRLDRIVSSNPSPAVTGRLVRPILLPLWAIYCYRGAPAANSSAKTLAFNLLDSFFSRSGTTAHLKLILGHLLIDGGSNWGLGPGSAGGIEIRAANPQIPKDAVPSIMKIDDRTSSFAKIAANVDKETMGEFFVFLVGGHLIPSGRKPDLSADELQDLIQVDLLQRLLPVAREAFSSNQLQILRLIRQMFQGCSEMNLDDQTSQKVSLASLSNIVQAPDQDPAATYQLSDDMILVATSLLNAIIAGPDVKVEATIPIVGEILGSVELLAERPPTYLSESTISSIDVSRSLVRGFLSKLDDGRPEETNTEAIDQQLASQVTADLTSELPPIRTSAIHALQRLIKTPSVAIDTPAITLLLLNQIRSEPDEYVHLAAIAALSTLATARDAGFVVRTTASAFQDADEAAGVDQRLRVGEALAAIVDALTSPDRQHRLATAPATQDLLRRVAEAATAVAGRRGRRDREANELAAAKARQRDAEREWGGEVPDLAALQRAGGAPADDGRTAREAEEDGLAQRVLDAWQDTGGEEDARLRASALGVLARALERAGGAMAPATVRAAAEVALGALGGGLDAGEGRAIVRRAAVLVFMAHLLAVNEEAAVATLDAETWAAVEGALERTREGDEDALVRSHAADVLESLEAWRMGRIAAAAREGGGLGGGVLGLTSVRGLPDLQPRGASGKIQVVEEI
jgi:hypothetical protein